MYHNGSENFKKYRPKTRVLNASLKKDNLVGFVFAGGVGDVVGPKENTGFYHVFEIIKKHSEMSKSARLRAEEKFDIKNWIKNHKNVFMRLLER